MSDGHPVMHPMLLARAAALSETGRHAEALRDAQKAVALFPRSGRAYLERAIAKEGLRDAPESVLADFKRAAELDAGFTLAYEHALARLTPAKAGHDATLAGVSAPTGAQSLLAAAQRRVEVTPSDLVMGAAIAGLVGLVAAAGFMSNRRGS